MDLGDFDCTNINTIPVCPTNAVEAAAAPYNITIGSNPCGTIEVICSDDQIVDVCGDQDYTIMRTITVFDDLDGDMELDQVINGDLIDEEFEICVFTIGIVVDLDPPTTTCPDGGELGCNPDAAEYAADDAPTWVDVCDANLSTGVIEGTPVQTDQDGCRWSVTHKYWATDACENSDTCYQTFTWTVDNDPPTTTCPDGGELGCNPDAAEYAADDAPTWVDVCDANLSTGVIEGTPVQTDQDGCRWSVTHKYWATDACENSDTCYQTFTWTVDNDPPTTTCPDGGELGCNPDAAEYAADDAPTWVDVCDANLSTGVIEGTPVQTDQDGCRWSVTHKYWATDACENSDTCYQTFTWTVDNDPPTTTCPDGGELGCNPDAAEYAADDAPTWVDVCDANLSTGVIEGTPVQTDQDGCRWSVTHKYWATDACENSDTCYQTFTWTVDNDPPTTTCPDGGELGCNPDAAEYAADDAPTWVDVL